MRFPRTIAAGPCWPNEQLWIQDGTEGTAFLYGVSRLPTTLLIAFDSRIQRRWDGFVAAAQLAFALESLVGPPRLRR